MINGLRHEVQQQYRTLQSCRLQPHVLDDYTVGRVVKVYTDVPSQDPYPNRPDVQRYRRALCPDIESVPDKTGFSLHAV
jgi:hypothetical protein